MTDFKEYADQLLEDYNVCCRARPRDNTVNIQLLKDAVGKWASYLATQRSWGTETDLAEACYQFESRLNALKEKLVIEVLRNGTI
jgi:hypothetical protein